jgi:endonuclease YncB( thermonuclease family)
MNGPFRLHLASSVYVGLIETTTGISLKRRVQPKGGLTMRKRILIAALLAGAATTLAAFAPLPSTATAMIAATGDNVTVIHKTNPNWPVRGLMTTQPCALNACVEV